MRRTAAILAAALLLPGCLTTKHPVFDETNSRPVAEMPEFMALLEAWEAFSGPDGSPRELITEGARGIVVDGIVVAQERSDYFALTMLAGRPATCAIYADRDLEATASSFGVTVAVDREDRDSLDVVEMPAPVLADGRRKALMAFIRDQFANQRLVCIANPRRKG